MAGIRHLIDTEAHKALFEELRGEMGSAFASLSESVNGLLEPIRTATHFPDPNTIMKRDGAGRVRVADPMDKQDVVTLNYFNNNQEEHTHQLFTVSGVYTAKYTGVVLLLIVNGGNGGGIGTRSGAQRQGFTLTATWINKGDTYAVMIGAGGVGATGGTGTPTANGGSGGISSFNEVTCITPRTEAVGMSGGNGITLTDWGYPEYPTAGAGGGGAGGIGFGAGGGGRTNTGQVGGRGADGCVLVIELKGGKNAK